MFTSAADFHHVGLLGFFAVFATELAAFFGLTVTGPVGARTSCIFSHESEPPYAFKLAGSVVGGAVALC